MSAYDPAATLEKLRWHEDMAVYNPFGEHVWLRACYDASGKRIGITDCCPVSEPCPLHAAMTPSSAPTDRRDHQP